MRIGNRPRFSAEDPATDWLKRQMRSDGFDELLIDDPQLLAMEAWRMIGRNRSCDCEDAKVLRFFGIDPSGLNQTDAADRVDDLLGVPANAARWQAHPELPEAMQDAVVEALDGVTMKACDLGLFDSDAMVDFNVAMAFEVPAERYANELNANGVPPRTARRLIRERFLLELRELAGKPMRRRSTSPLLTDGEDARARSCDR